MKSVRIRSFSGLYFPAFALNTDQKILEYGLIFYYFQVVHVFDSQFFYFSWQSLLQRNKELLLKIEKMEDFLSETKENVRDYSLDFILW